MPVKIAIRGVIETGRLLATFIRAVVRAMARVLARMAVILARGVVRVLLASARLGGRIARRLEKATRKSAAQARINAIKFARSSLDQGKTVANRIRGKIKSLRISQRLGQKFEATLADLNLDLEDRRSGASDPGQSPYTQSGELIAGVIAEHNRIISGASYSANLELGTLRMEPRPFMFQGIEMARLEAMIAVANSLEQRDV